MKSIFSKFKKIFIVLMFAVIGIFAITSTKKINADTTTPTKLWLTFDKESIDVLENEVADFEMKIEVTFWKNSASDWGTYNVILGLAVDLDVFKYLDWKWELVEGSEFYNALCNKTDVIQTDGYNDNGYQVQSYVVNSSDAPLCEIDPVSGNNFIKAGILTLTVKDGMESEYISTVKSLGGSYSLFVDNWSNCYSSNTGFECMGMDYPEIWDTELACEISLVSPSTTAEIDTVQVAEASSYTTLTRNALTFAYTTSAYSVGTLKLKATAKDNGTIVVKNGGTTVNPSSGVYNITINKGGTTTVTIAVTAQAGNAGPTYTLTITSPTDNTATLTALSISASPTNTVKWDKSFASGTTSYTVTVPESTTSLTVTPTKYSTAKSVTVNGTANSATITNLTQPISIVVTAQDGTTTKTYTVNVETKSDDTSLSLAVAGSDGTSYTTTQSGTTFTISDKVAATETSLKITLTLPNGATAKIGSTAATSGVAATVSYATSISIVVTSEIGTTKTYTLVSTKATTGGETGGGTGGETPEPTPDSTAKLTGITITANDGSEIKWYDTSNNNVVSFNEGVYSYTIRVANTATSIVVTPTKYSTCSGVTVNGSANSATITNLTGTISIVVTAEDGTTTKTYSIAIMIYNPNSNVIKFEIAEIEDFVYDDNTNEYFKDSNETAFVVGKDIDKLTFDIDLTDGSTYEIIDGDSLDFGNNTAIVQIKDANNNVRTIKIHVTRLGSASSKPNHTMTILLVIAVCTCAGLVAFLAVIKSKQKDSFSKIFKNKK